MDLLIRDISTTLKSLGHTGGGGDRKRTGYKSDDEAALLAVRNVVMKYHGGIMIPENLAKGEKAENGLIEEAGKTIGGYFCIFLPQIEEGRNRRYYPIGRKHHPMDSQAGRNSPLEVCRGPRWPHSL